MKRESRDLTTTAALWRHKPGQQRQQLRYCRHVASSLPQELLPSRFCPCRILLWAANMPLAYPFICKSPQSSESTDEKMDHDSVTSYFLLGPYITHKLPGYAAKSSYGTSVRPLLSRIRKSYIYHLMPPAPRKKDIWSPRHCNNFKTIERAKPSSGLRTQFWAIIIP